MVNYKNGKIYKLWSPEGDMIYIGSTCRELARRKAGHKGNPSATSKILFDTYTDIRIELIEEYPCDNKEQLNRKEGEYIRTLECVNKIVAGRTIKEYREDNKEHKKDYYQKNKERVAEKQKEYYERNKEHLAEYQKEYNERNKEHLVEKKREYRERKRLEKVSIST